MMRVTVLVGGFLGLAVVVVYTLSVMEHREWFGRPAWVVAAIMKPRIGYHPVWMVLILWAIIPALFGGMLGDCEWTRRGVCYAVIGAMLLASAAFGWGFL